MLPFRQQVETVFARIPWMTGSNFSESFTFLRQYFLNSFLICLLYLSLFYHLFWIGFRSYWPSTSFPVPFATSILWLLPIHLFRLKIYKLHQFDLGWSQQVLFFFIPIIPYLRIFFYQAPLSYVNSVKIMGFWQFFCMLFCA